ncbi:MAG: polysaccharide deacetylase family protein [Clostridia bacterium]|nr:polysaccharide deacetylase family protein [Clostridia bacterium]
MKKTVIRSLFYIILPTILVSLPYAFVNSKAPSYDYYFKAVEGNQRPEVCPEAAELLEHKDIITIGPDEKKIYLTFDAGFDNDNMGKILDTLKQKGVSGAFFVDGNFVKSQPDLVNRICSEGHILGNHTLSHADMSTLSDFEKYKTQVVSWNDLVTEVGGTPTEYFRFPCGRFSETALQYNEKLGLKTVFWSFAYYDWDVNDQPDTQAALQKILSRTHNGCIMLLHSVSKTNAELLPTLIDRLQQQGYTFGSLSDF